MSHGNNQLDLAALRERLRADGGRALWRSLEELAETPAFQEFLHREFPEHASEWTDPVTRRQFLTLMGASLALAGVAGCARSPQAPSEAIVPYVRQPEHIVPGKPLFFATATALGGAATGLLVEQHMGRPTKVEGNPEHPASRGATDRFSQASVLTLYDPDRAQAVRHLGRVSTWGSALAALRAALDGDPVRQTPGQRAKAGAGLRILTETVISPTLAGQLEAILERFPQAKWVQYEPVGRGTALEGTRLAFGAYANTYYDLARAEVVLALDSDFLDCGPGHLRYTHDFMARRRVRAGQTAMNRLYAIESTPTLTGCKADHCWRMKAGAVEGVARALAAQIDPKYQPLGGALPASIKAEWLAALARDLRHHAGRCVVIPGDFQTPTVHAIAHALNHALGNVGATVHYTEPVEAVAGQIKRGRPVDQFVQLRELTEEMASGQVEMLVILGGNPVYTAPADLRFREHLAKVPFRIHLSLYFDETSAYCHWHVPASHELEAWGDVRTYDGTVSIIQPLIAPLYSTRSACEFLSAFLNATDLPGYNLVRGYWREHGPKQKSADDFETFWRKTLHDGVMPDSKLPAKTVTLRDDWIKPPAREGAAPAESPAAGLEIIFRPDPTVYDGRFANNGWLQELPKPLTKLTWDNAVILSPRTAERYGLSFTVGPHGGSRGETISDVVSLQLGPHAIPAAAIWIMPGHPDDAVTVHLGYGRTRAGRVGSHAGFNAYQLRTADAPWFASGLVLRKTGGRYTLASTQHHHAMEGRDLVRAGTVGEFAADPQGFGRFRHGSPEVAREHAHGRGPLEHKTPHGPPGQQPLSLYEPFEYPRYKWGMAIDLTACTGCSACVIACQAENNIPVVGKDQVTRGREMHWLRIDRYYAGLLDNPKTYFQPVPCMHCEQAPCEVVCPVAATVHSAEGLNDMVYNRCVGTRYCSHNCPYKVRRFNFFLYADWTTESLKLLRNPDVTVRSRGVMEKCTYCVQRINHARIEAEKEDRRIRDGEVLTACQAACPAGAIAFGDLNLAESVVAQWKAQPHNYGLLEELNTQPRTTYLAAVANPNPELAGA